MLRGRDFRIDETQENIEVFRPFELEMKLDTRMCRISFGTDLILEAEKFQGYIYELKEMTGIK